MILRISVLLLAASLLAACGTTAPPQPITPAPQQGGTGAQSPTAPQGYPGPVTTPDMPATSVPGPATAYPAGTPAPATPLPAATVTPAAAGIPEACVPSGQTQAAYFDLLGNYCLLYPAGFTVRDQRPGPLAVFGPPLDQTIEPVQAVLTIDFDRTGGLTLQQIVDQLVAEVGNSVPVTRTATMLGGEPAAMLTGMPGRTLNWQIITVHGDWAYRLILFPVDPGFPQAQPDIEKLWAAASASFTFLPAGFASAFAACPPGTESAAPYLNPFAGYCFLYAPNISISEATSAMQVTTLSAPPREPGVEPVMATLAISSSQSAGGRDVRQIVDAYLATFPPEVAAGITRTQATIGGQLALVLDGVPARLPARQAFVVYQGSLYEFTLQPFRDPAFAEYQDEVDALWRQVTETIVFVARP